jgi:NTP pyrophosphatase (non-canonical NTP hydrolase)
MDDNEDSEKVAGSLRENAASGDGQDFRVPQVATSVNSAMSLPLPVKNLATAISCVPLPKQSAGLQELQAYVKVITAGRGFDKNTVGQGFMLLIEEVGELARAARKTAGLRFAEDTHKAEVAHEAADVLTLLLGICNMPGGDLAQTFSAKETLNRTRTWK